MGTITDLKRKLAANTFIKLMFFPYFSRYKVLLSLFNGSLFIGHILKRITSPWIDSRKFEDLADYSRDHSHKVEYIFKNSRTLYYSSPIFNQVTARVSNLSSITGPEQFAAVLKNVEVIGGSSLVILNKESVLYDIKNFDKSQKFRYSDHGIRHYKDNFCIITSDYSDIEFDEGIFLIGNFSWNYYHFIFEILTKFEHVINSKIDTNIPLLVDKVCIDTPQFMELFALLNVECRRLIPLDKGKRYKIRKALYFSCPNIIPPDFLSIKNICPEDVLFDIRSIQFLRSELLPFSSKKSFPPRIYLSRRKSSGRRQFNEAEVTDILCNFGFEIIHPEDYSVADQISLFQNADFIAGGSGAAFTNLVFCKQFCKVIIFSKYELLYSGFSTIASYVGVNLLYVTDNLGTINDHNDIHGSFNINKEKLSQMVSKWIA